MNPRNPGKNNNREHLNVAHIPGTECGLSYLILTSPMRYPFEGGRNRGIDKGDDLPKVKQFINDGSGIQS